MINTQRQPRIGAARAARGVDGFSRIGPIQWIPAVLKDLGVEPESALAKIGVRPALFSDPDRRIGNDEVGQLLGSCARLTGCQHFGLLVGHQAGLASIGLLGPIARHAPDVVTGLRAINRYLSVNNGIAIAALSQQGSLAMWSYAIYQGGLDGTDQIYQCASAVACNIMRQLCGRDWLPHEVQLPCSRPGDARPFRNVYRAPVRFDADHLNIVFAQSWLGCPTGEPDPALHRMLLEQAAEMEAKIAVSVPQIVRSVLRRLMLSGRTSIEDVASVLSVHRRTLDRHLDLHGVSFRRLADEVRFAISQQLLRDTEMSISEISTALHYASPSGFASAFRSWSGTTASQWRTTVAHRCRG